MVHHVLYDGVHLVGIGACLKCFFEIKVNSNAERVSRVARSKERRAEVDRVEEEYE